MKGRKWKGELKDDDLEIMVIELEFECYLKGGKGLRRCNSYDLNIL